MLPNFMYDSYHDTYEFCYKHEMIIAFNKGGQCPECEAWEKANKPIEPPPKG